MRLKYLFYFFRSSIKIRVHFVITSYSIHYTKLYEYNQDIFVNVAGGIRLEETAADLPLLCAVAGSYRDQIIPSGTAAFGEVGLGGEVRAVPMAESRLNEAAKMGFTRVLLPASNAERLSSYNFV